VVSALNMTVWLYTNRSFSGYNGFNICVPKIKPGVHTIRIFNPTRMVFANCAKKINAYKIKSYDAGRNFIDSKYVVICMVLLQVFVTARMVSIGLFSYTSTKPLLRSTKLY